jgi:hypothetical protein
MRHFLPANPHTVRGDCRIDAAQKAQFPADCPKPGVLQRSCSIDKDVARVLRRKAADGCREENAAKKQMEAWFRIQSGRKKF